MNKATISLREIFLLPLQTSEDISAFFEGKQSRKKRFILHELRDDA